LILKNLSAKSAKNAAAKETSRVREQANPLPNSNSLNFPKPPGVLHLGKIFESGSARLRAAPRGAQILVNSFLYLDYRDQSGQKDERTFASGNADESDRVSRNSRIFRERALYSRLKI